jgi:ABC-type nitrate/sulfonate/bicarbonate transport system substrate-binding protein
MREMFFFGNEVKNSWGTLATTDKLIKENPKVVAGFVRATLKAMRYLRQDKEGTISAMTKFAGVSRQQATSVYEDIMPTFTRNGAVDDETQRNDLQIIRQVVNTNEAVSNAKGYDFSFALEADRQLNKAGWKP